MNALWEQPDFRAVAGDAWRPGGLALTRRSLDWCAAHGLLPPTALAVDMGCGAGATLQLLAARGLRAVGVDREPAPPGAAVGAGAGFRIRADVAHPPLAAGCADIVLLECVLSLLPEPLVALRAAWAVLKAGGICLMGDVTLRDGALCGDRKGDSCLSGARPGDMWAEMLETANFRILLHEDHSRALAELAARLCWYGAVAPGGNDPERHALGGMCSCETFLPRRRYGYGLWIARKEAVCTP
ncbi:MULTISPECIES: DVU_1556 family methyltransferase [unclassified Desulfovibrio]|uniref:DVU_1556 family methyltransferase n=1 Tax=unclassified Desulfovibrio TaxID=2593640 RepID=UPI000F5F8D39|nr:MULTISPECIES: class I SAM-dependent methyltransferase [unclassified Desulfovibrio]RRD70325.1 class I SAM-dependent methyltransferase [Desulfovibrio sp. OH1209_COT-279]RRD86822.1 class I SAM-dependent methyltransferase [Desulfovibrio sp. OH1186_COT-070]